MKKHILNNNQSQSYFLLGTAAYLAPETLKQVGHGKSVDIWAFGVMMFILLLQESPFFSENLSELFRMIVHEPIEWDWYRQELSPEALSLLQGLLTKEVSDRLGCGIAGISEIKSHPFFKSTDFEALARMEVKPFIRPKLRVRFLSIIIKKKKKIWFLIFHFFRLQNELHRKKKVNYKHKNQDCFHRLWMMMNFQDLVLLQVMLQDI